MSFLLKVGVLNFQRCKNNEINLQRVKDMASYLPKSKISIVFEFRDNSWFVP